MLCIDKDVNCDQFQNVPSWIGRKIELISPNWIEINIIITKQSYSYENRIDSPNWIEIYIIITTKQSYSFENDPCHAVLKRLETQKNLNGKSHL